MNILSLNQISENASEIYKSFGEFEVFERGKLPKNPDILVERLEKVDRNVLESFHNLKIISTNTTGNDHIDEKECEKRGIRIVSLKGEVEFLESITSTAEHTIGLILALLRKIPWAFEDVKQEYWDRERFKGNTLNGKTLGIIGNGRVGKQVSHYAAALGMSVMGIDKGADQVIWENLFRESDIISIHLPLNEETEGLIDMTLLDIMKPTAWLINTSRGKILSEECLLRNLQEKRLAGAALDVVDDEPGISKELLEYVRAHDNLLITPHLGGCTFEDTEKTEVFIAEKVRDLVLKNKSNN